MRWVLKEVGIQVLIFGFIALAFASRQLPVTDGFGWPRSGDITMLIAGFLAYSAGSLAMLNLKQ